MSVEKKEKKNLFTIGITISLFVSVTFNGIVISRVQNTEKINVQTVQNGTAYHYKKGYEEGINACKTAYAQSLQSHGHIDIKSPSGMITLIPQ